MQRIKFQIQTILPFESYRIHSHCKSTGTEGAAGQPEYGNRTARLTYTKYIWFCQYLIYFSTRHKLIGLRSKLTMVVYGGILSSLLIVSAVMENADLRVEEYSSRRVVL
jgi:hypothetical protein